MKGINLAIMIIIGLFTIVYGDEAPAGIYGRCWYVENQGNILAPACSVDIYCKNLTTGQVYTGNSKKNFPDEYVAQQSYSVDVYIPAGNGYYYAVAGYKWNSSGPFAGAWKINYTGSYYYPTPNWSAGRCDILLRKIPGTEPQGGNR